MLDPARIPVIVGTGEFIDRDDRYEPRYLLLEAAHQAGKETNGLLASLDSIDVVSIMSCTYADIAQLLAKDLGVEPARMQESVAGGEKPVRLLVEAAERIAAGTSKVALICGAEAMHTRARAAKTGTALQWGPIDPDARQLTAHDFVTPLAARYGLVQPSQVYPLYENATRKAWGLTFDQANAESAEIWSRNADAASHNPNAWLGQPHSAEQISAEYDGNRMIAFPYRKLMVSNPQVNQSGALLLTSLSMAREAGIPDKQLVYVWSGARANEPADFLSRDSYIHSTAQEAVLRSTVEQSALQAEDFDLVELYSCFPIVPKMARRILGLSEHGRFSLAGGLTFFGGPANNYMTHALAAAVHAIRDNQGRTALIYGQGEYVTKHAAVVLSAMAPAAAPQMLDVQTVADAAASPAPHLLEDYEGNAQIESFTIVYDRSGKPTHAPVVTRTPSGARVVAMIAGEDEAGIRVLEDRSTNPIGAQGKIGPGENGLLRFSF